MNTENSQPDSGSQEAVSNPVASKLGLLDAKSLSEIIKSGSFLDEKEAVPAKEEQKSEVEADEVEAEEAEKEEEETQEEIPEEKEDSSQLTKGVQKRINKLVAAKKAAQSELEAQKSQLLNMQRELDTLKQTQGSKQAELSNAVEALSTPDQVRSEYNKAVEVILWCEENPDGGVVTMPDGQESELSSDDVRKMKRLAIRRKEIELPERMRFVTNEQSAETEVVKDFPWWNKPDTEEYQAAQVVLQEFPELKKRRADWKHVAGLIVLGMKAYTDQKAAKKAVPAIKKAPSQPGVTKAPPTSSSMNDIAKAKQLFAKSNSDKSGLTDLVKAMGFV